MPSFTMFQASFLNCECKGSAFSYNLQILLHFFIQESSFLPFHTRILSPRLSDGERYMVFHRQKPYHANDDKCHDNRNVHVQSKFHQHPIDQTSEDTRHGINLLLEDDGDIVKKHIAYHATGRTGNASHDYRHPIGIAAVKGLLQPHYSEQRKSERVEQKPCVLSRRLNDFAKTMTNTCAITVHIIYMDEVIQKGVTPSITSRIVPPPIATAMLHTKPPSQSKCFAAACLMPEMAKSESTKNLLR